MLRTGEDLGSPLAGKLRQPIGDFGVSATACDALEQELAKVARVRASNRLRGRRAPGEGN